MRVDRGDGAADGRHAADLTCRQAEVVQLLVNGMQVKQIARCLGISARTVAVHLRAARQRAGVRTRDELAAWAVWTGVAVPGRPAPAAEAGRGGRACGPGRGGRPTVMTRARIALALDSLPGQPVAEVARQIGVSRSTLYQWLAAHGGRGRTLPPSHPDGMT